MTKKKLYPEKIKRNGIKFEIKSINYQKKHKKYI